MRIKIVLLFLSLFIINSFAGFEEGVNFYKQGDYTAAKEEFLKIDNPNEYIYYNIGNSFYRLGDKANAVYFYLKALNINPGLREAQNNLISLTGTKKMLHWYFIPFNVNKVYLVWNFLFLIFIIFIIVNSYTKKSFRIYLYFLTIVFLFVSIYSISLYFFFDNHRPVVFIENSIILSSPSENSVNISDFNKGSFAFIIDESKNYYKIIDVQGISGWVEKESVKKVN